MHGAHIFIGQSVGISAEAVLVESGVGFRTKYGDGFLQVLEQFWEPFPVKKMWVLGGT